ncbi:hypothetical protein ACFU7T_20130 [Streptomyces sp. NPDC057555]|uniref:hypothetical protein n=1 Tax=Streptomyces sp. NPDC057555 TaxID=3346166 RepID=UPI0036AF6405
MDQHAQGDRPVHEEGLPEVRAARSHGVIEPEHGATAPVPTEESAPATARRSSLVLPIIAAVAFGCYTIWMNHHNGSSGGQSALLGLIAAVVTGALGVTLVHFQSTMLTETRALAYGALFGASMGWLYSLGGTTPSVLKSVIWGLVMFTVMFIVSLYVFRTHRVREPHGLHRPRRPHAARHHGPHGAH